MHSSILKCNFASSADHTNVIFIVNISLDKKGSLNTFLRVMCDLKNINNKTIIYVFCRLTELKEFESDNVKIIVLKLNFLDRVLFELSFLKRWSKTNCIYADVIISLQNTSINYFKPIKQIILYQQSIPFVNIKWNFFKKTERTMFFYKNIYPFFVRRYIDCNTILVAPTKWVKSAINSKWNICNSNIKVIYSKFEDNNFSGISKNLSDNYFHIFYPANASIHKNHKIIVNALSILKAQHIEEYNKTKVYFTINIVDSKDLYDEINKCGIESKITFLGEISHSEVLSYYKSCDLLVFPSYIESFGLPLIEAANFGLPILASDLSYAHEVIGNYDGVSFLNYQDPNEWAKSLYTKINENIKYDEYIPKLEGDYSDFYGLISDYINDGEL